MIDKVNRSVAIFHVNYRKNLLDSSLPPVTIPFSPPSTLGQSYSFKTQVRLHHHPSETFFNSSHWQLNEIQMPLLSSACVSMFVS